MHKRLILNKPNGAPVGVLNTLDWWQAGMTEALSAICADATVPVALSGMVVAGLNISAGWFYYGGEIIPFVGGSIPGFSIGQALAIVIGEAITQKEYADGVMYDFLSSKSASLQVVASGAINTTDKLAYTSLITLEKHLGTRKVLTGSQVLTNPGGVSAGNITGSVDYRLNEINRTLQLSGTITFNTAQSITNPTQSVTLFTLASAYRPAKRTPFTIPMQRGLTDAAGELLTELYAEVDTNGDMIVDAVRPALALTGYQAIFNLYIPID